MRHTLMILSVLFLLIAGCAEEPTVTLEDEPTTTTTDIDVDVLLQEERTPIDEGTVRVFDDDGDGSDDRGTLSFEPMTVDGVTIEQTVELVEDEAVVFSVELSGKGGYVMTIPKSFAEDVSDITFSVEPDEILDRDPKVAWLDGIIARSKGRLTATIGWDVLMSGDDPSLVDAMKNLDDIRHLYALQRMKAEAEKNHGYVNIIDVVDQIGKYPESFTLDDCGELYDPDGGGDLLFACRAMVSGDVAECEQAHQVLRDKHFGLSGGDEEQVVQTTKADAVKECRLWSFMMRYAGCQQEQGIARDTCIREGAVWSGHDGCAKISDLVQHRLCKAEMTQSDSYCIDLLQYPALAEEDAMIGCCGLIKDSARRSRCEEAVREERREEAERQVGTLDVTYDPYDDELETGKEYTFSFGLDSAPEGTKYVIEWDDGGYNSTSYQPEYTHRFEEQGVYTVRVQARDSSDALLAAGSVKVETKLPYERLALLQSTTQVSAMVCGATTETFGDGHTSDHSRLCVQAYQPDATLSWNGRLFSVDFAEQVNDQTHITIRMDGVVDEEATELENLDVEVVYRYTGGSLDGKERTSSFSVSGVALEPKSPIPTVRTDWYKPLFRAYVEGRDTGQYVDSVSQVISAPDSDASSVLGGFSFVDASPASYLLVVFSTERVSANDDPGYYSRP